MGIDDSLIGLQGYLVGEEAWQIALKHMFAEDLLRDEMKHICYIASKCPYSSLKMQCLQQLWEVKSGSDAILGTQVILEGKSMPDWVATKVLEEVCLNPGAILNAQCQLTLHCKLPAVTMTYHAFSHGCILAHLGQNVSHALPEHMLRLLTTLFGLQMLTLFSILSAFGEHQYAISLWINHFASL